MKSLREYIAESEHAASQPVTGDYFAINIREETLFETYVCDETEDGIVIYADEVGMKLLEDYGYLIEPLSEDHHDFAIDSKEDSVDVVDQGEYDQEGDMAKDDLETIVRAARKLTGMLDDNENMPEWVQSKINKAADYVDTAADYIESNKERAGSLDEVSLDLAKRARDQAEYFVDMDYDDMRDRPYGYSEKQRSKFQRYIDRKEPRAKGDRDWDPPKQGVAEGGYPSPHNYDSDEDYYAAVDRYNRPRGPRPGDDDWEETAPGDDIPSRRRHRDDDMDEAKYQGREVPLGKPMKGDVKKSKVYVRGPKGNVVKVNFGQKGMKIKKNIPGRRKNFRARHNCDNPGPRWKARYWSCRAW